MVDRSEATRGPYIPNKLHERMVELSNKKDMSVEEAYCELIRCNVNEDGNIVANTVKMKFGE